MGVLEEQPHSTVEEVTEELVDVRLQSSQGLPECVCALDVYLSGVHADNMVGVRNTDEPARELEGDIRL